MFLLAGEHAIWPSANEIFRCTSRACPRFCFPSGNKALELVDADPILHHNAGIIFQVKMSNKACSERTRQLQQEQTSVEKSYNAPSLDVSGYHLYMG